MDVEGQGSAITAATLPNAGQFKYQLNPLERNDTLHSGHLVLPGETIDNVIDHLHNDVLTLSASSLVCRDWLPSCRYHLFETVRCNPVSATRTLPHLYDWLLASPDVHPYIKTITVFAPILNPPLPDLRVEDLERMLSYLPLLRCLSLHGVSLSSSHASDVNRSYVSSTGGARRLHTLSIDCCTTSDDTFHPLCAVLGLFAELDELTIQGSTCEWHRDQVTAFSSRLLELAKRFRVRRALRLMLFLLDPGEDEVICYLLEHATRRWALQELVLMAPTVGVVARIIRHCQGTLRTLLLDPNFVLHRNIVRHQPLPEPSRSWATVPIADCKHLESLSIPLAMPISDPIRARVLGHSVASLCAAADLVKHRPPSVKNVSFTFAPPEGNISYAEYWDQLDLATGWCSMDEALMQMPMLEIVRAMFYSAEYRKWAQAHAQEDLSNLAPDVALSLFDKELAVHGMFLKRVLPKVYARGIVRVGLEGRYSTG